MATPVYATQADYLAFNPTGTTATEEQLAAASEIIDEILVGAIYDVDDDELPTDPDVADALKRATCAQAQWFVETGDTTASGAAGTNGVIESASIGSSSYTFSKSGGTAITRTASGVEIAPRAIRILRNAGLLAFGTYVYG